MRELSKYLYLNIFLAIIYIIICVIVCVEVSKKEENNRNVMDEIMLSKENVYYRMPTVKEVTERDIHAGWKRIVRFNEQIYKHYGEILPEISSYDNEKGFISVDAKNEDGYGYVWTYRPVDKKLHNGWIEIRASDFKECCEWKYRRIYNLTESDMKRYRDMLLGIYLRNWFEYVKSDYSIENLGDMELEDVYIDNAVYIGKSEKKIAIEWKEDEVRNPTYVMDEKEENIVECEERNYKVYENVCHEIVFESKDDDSYYDEKYINLYLNDTEYKNFRIVYADEKYLCIWKQVKETGKQEIMLLDLYQTNFGKAPLCVGENQEYGFELPITELEKQICSGECRIDKDGNHLAENKKGAYVNLLECYFDNRQYMYRTYIGEDYVGFLIPTVLASKGYIRIEVEYDWKKQLANYDAEYYPEELAAIFENTQKELEKQKQLVLVKEKTNNDEIEASVSIVFHNNYVMQTKCVCGIYGRLSSFKYILYDVDTQKELGIDDILVIDSDFIQWLKYSGESSGNLTKVTYSIEEGCEQTQEMLKNCPDEKLKEALLECEFYLEQGVIHLYLPYWNYKTEETGWVSNGTDKVWKNWLTIKTEDIEEFIKGD